MPDLGLRSFVDSEVRFEKQAIPLSKVGDGYKPVEHGALTDTALAVAFDAR